MEEGGRGGSEGTFQCLKEGCGAKPCVAAMALAGMVASPMQLVSAARSRSTAPLLPGLTQWPMGCVLPRLAAPHLAHPTRSLPPLSLLSF